MPQHLLKPANYPEKTTLDDADEWVLADSADTDNMKRMTSANLKSEINEWKNIQNESYVSGPAGAYELDPAVHNAIVFGGDVDNGRPNKVGIQSHPNIAFTGTPRAEWLALWSADDVGYPAGLATVTLTGGNDNVNNQIAGVVFGSHNYLKYSSGGHGAILGNAYNYNAAERSVIVGGTRNALQAGDYIFLGCGFNNLFNTTGASFGGTGSENTVTGVNTAYVLANSCTIGGTYSGVFIGNNCSATAIYSLVLNGLNNNATGNHAVAVAGRDQDLSGTFIVSQANVATVTHDYVRSYGQNVVSRMDHAEHLSRGALVVDGDAQVVRGMMSIRKTTTGFSAIDIIDYPAGKHVTLDLEIKITGMRQSDNAIAKFTGGFIATYNADTTASDITDNTGTTHGVFRLLDTVIDNIGLANGARAVVTGSQFQVQSGGDAAGVLWVAEYHGTMITVDQ